MAYKDKEKHKEYQKQYREANKERLNKIKKEWREKNSEKLKAYRVEYRAKNNDILNEKDKKRYYENIEYQRIKRKRTYERDKTDKKRLMFQGAKDRAKKKGLEFTITLDDIQVPTHCPIFNLPLFTSRGKKTDNSPSLDRINNNRGYVPGNVLVISYRANQIKNNATADELMRLALFMKSYNYG